MSWQTNPKINYFRSIARRAGVTRIIGRIMQRGNYEQAFNDALFAAISPGNVIWDVGANVGYYTRKFGQATGQEGHVFGFEPFPSTFKRLRAETEKLENVTVQPIALGAEVGKMTMQAGGDDLGATSRIVEGATGHETKEVEIATGDSVIERSIAASPAVIKIDTEGFELDVLIGMSTLLDERSVRSVFVEVHFSILEDRGMADAPDRIEKLLIAKGFTLRWVDPSHIVANRI